MSKDQSDGSAVSALKDIHKIRSCWQFSVARTTTQHGCSLEFYVWAAVIPSTDVIGRDYRGPGAEQFQRIEIDAREFIEFSDRSNG